MWPMWVPSTVTARRPRPLGVMATFTGSCYDGGRRWTGCNRPGMRKGPPPTRRARGGQGWVGAAEHVGTCGGRAGSGEGDRAAPSDHSLRAVDEPDVDVDHRLVSERDRAGVPDGGGWA